MRLNIALACVLLAVSNPLAAATVKGVVLLNEMGGRGIANVKISAAGGANPVRSFADGTFVLEFPNKQPGEKVRLLVQKPGMVVVNYHESRFTLPKAPDADPLILVLCREEERQEWTRRYYQLDSLDPIEQRYRKQLADLQTKNQATEAAMEQLRIERNRAREAEQRAAEELARVKAEEVSDFFVHLTPPVYRSDAAMALNSLGIMYRRQNRMEKARKAFDKALEISRILAQQNSVIYLPDVEETLNNLGNMLSDQNQMEEALGVYNEALMIGNELVQQKPVIYLPGVASTLNNRGILLHKLNRMEEARKDLGKALESYRKLAQLNPATYLPHVAETLNNLGSLNHDQNRMEEAREAFSRALSIYEILARENPGQYVQEVESTYAQTQKISRQLAQQNPAYLPVVADMLSNRGTMLSDQNRMQEAREAYAEALKITTMLSQQNPVTYLPKVAMMLIDLGILDRGQDRTEEARKAFSEALAIFETFARENPGRYEQEVKSTRELLDGPTDRRKP